MPLRIPDAPKESIAALQPRLQRWTSQPHLAPRLLSHILAPGGRRNLTVSTPHQVFVLAVESVAAGHDLSGAQPVMWRYLLGEPGKVSITADVGQQATRHEFSAVGRPPWLARFESALKDAEAKPEVVKGKYAVAVLEIPGLYVVALWLRDEAGSKDLLIPVNSMEQSLTVMHTYTPSQFLDALKPAAESKLALAGPGLYG